MLRHHDDTRKEWSYEKGNFISAFTDHGNQPFD